MSKNNPTIRVRDEILYHGWLIVVMDEVGMDHAREVMCTRHAAVEHALSNYRDLNWRVHPVAGSIRIGSAGVDSESHIIGVKW
jgi:hypothetical protein